MRPPVSVIGGGLAGCEAAWQAARYGVDVQLHEMRPKRSGPAHHTGALAELVCSNSFRGAALENAVGLLKEELVVLDSLILSCARESAVPAGGALAVDRERFSAAVQQRIEEHPRISLVRDEVREIPLDLPVIVACGPLPSDEFLDSLDLVLRRSSPFASDDNGNDPSATRLHYYDAASPIVAADSIDQSQMYRKSRYDKTSAALGSADGDYLNIPLDRQTYAQLVRDLRTLERHPAKEFETPRYFEGCLPIEAMAERGDDVLRFGPLKPVGLRDPRTGEAPYAVVQLRQENREATAYNLVGFQTRLTWPAQREAFSKLPGLRDAE
ncbi:MAG: methylenetetrahydrofolate--tRNA-(uracil(54)-C(5))-methyltransferase (FADH(2)-oxidizing) TrmFO, partial [Candidatus Eremiobacteraeota bacterium]|nr:methylenetetrahydrofolate--tRNA-(uracil(54)-C(5))-methyltransferase (FADH(2)-oxidizing) TrmFO [Candidatus Eremiobacteraeota bacterium]